MARSAPDAQSSSAPRVATQTVFARATPVGLCRARVGWSQCIYIAIEIPSGKESRNRTRCCIGSRLRRGLPTFELTSIAAEKFTEFGIDVTKHCLSGAPPCPKGVGERTLLVVV